MFTHSELEIKRMMINHVNVLTDSLLECFDITSSVHAFITAAGVPDLSILTTKDLSHWVMLSLWDTIISVKDETLGDLLKVRIDYDGKHSRTLGRVPTQADINEAADKALKAGADETLKARDGGEIEKKIVRELIIDWLQKTIKVEETPVHQILIPITLCFILSTLVDGGKTDGSILMEKLIAILKFIIMEGNECPAVVN